MQILGTKHSRDMVIIAFITLITVFIWIGFETYRTITKDATSSKASQLTTPLNPTIRQDVFVKLEQAQP